MKLLHTGLDALRKYAAVLLLIAGAGLLYVFVSVQFWSIVGPILGVVIGSLVAVVGLVLGFVRKRSGKGGTETASAESPDPDPLDVRIPIVLASLYVVSMIVLFRFNTYYRPDLMYVLFGGYAGLIGYQIARGESRARVVPQILLLAFFTYWSSQFLFPAGMYGPDTHQGYLPTIRAMFTTHQIPAHQARYAGHLAYVSEFAFLSGLSAETAYYLLATLVLVGTVLLLGMLDRILPALNTKIALYSALVFSVMSWMIGRGMHPNKLNFFYPMILLIGMAAVQLYRLETSQHTSRRSWFFVGLVLSPALIYGHRFSAGAALVFLLVFAFFSGLSHTVLKSVYDDLPKGTPAFLVVLYTVGVVGNPLHQEPLLSRLAGLILSVLVETGATSSSAAAAGGGPGRYSALPLEVLVVSTAAQTILFVFMTIGAVWAFRKSDWEYDYVIVWMAFVSVLLVVSILTNSVDTAPQRFYALLGLFGFNVCAGVLFYYAGYKGVISREQLSFSTGRGVVAVLICVLAVTSLASPVADKATSPVADELPHFRQFDTAQFDEGNAWTGKYVSGNSTAIVGPNSNARIERTSNTEGRINTSSIKQTGLYSYSSLAERTGIVQTGGLTLGGRTFLFVSSPVKPTHDKMYSNGESHVYKAS